MIDIEKQSSKTFLPPEHLKFLYTRVFDWRLVFVLVMVVAAFLRIYQLQAESLWLDEGFSLRDAHISYSVAKASKPLYYWILSYWVTFGESDWWLRLPSVVFGVASVGVVFLIGRLIGGTKTGLLSGLLMAVSPLQINHSQEVRMYTLVTLTASLSLYFLLLALRTWRFRYMAGSAICAFLTILTHPMAVFLLLPENLAVLDAYRRKRRSLLPWVVLQVLIVLAWLPWLPQVLGFGNAFSDAAWTDLRPKPALADIPELWSWFGLGEWDSRFGRGMMQYPLHIYTWAFVLLLVYFVWKYRRNLEDRFLAGWLVIPTLALFTYSLVRTNGFVPRFLLFASPAFFVMSGYIWAKERYKVVFVLLGLVLLLVPVSKLVRYYQKPVRPQWKQAVGYITARERPMDSLGLYRKNNAYVFEHYYKGKVRWAGIGSIKLEPYNRPKWSDQQADWLVRQIPKAPRRWMIVAKVSVDAKKAIRSAIIKRYRVIDYRSFNDIEVYLLRDRS